MIGTKTGPIASSGGNPPENLNAVAEQTLGYFDNAASIAEAKLAAAAND